MLIESVNNSRVKRLIKLHQDKNLRRSEMRFVVEGFKLTQEALDSGVEMKEVFLTQQALEKEPLLCDTLSKTGCDIIVVPQHVMDKISATKTPQGMLCVAKMLDNRIFDDKIDTNGNYVVLDELRDPGNMGTILRTAEAFEITGVILSAGCTDLYGPKVVRAAAGSLFRVPVRICDDLCEFLERASLSFGMETFAAVPDMCSIDLLNRPFCSPGNMIVIGNEANGIRQEIIDACKHKIHIPMRGKTESLNAGVAGALFIWEMRKSIMNF